MKKCKQLQTLKSPELKLSHNAIAEQVRQKEKVYRFKTEFLNTISHEIRSSEANVISLLDVVEMEITLLQESVYSEIMERQTSLSGSQAPKNIHESFRRILSLVSSAKENAYHSLNSLVNLCNLHRLQSSNIQCDFETTDIRSMIENIINNDSFLKNRTVTVRLDMNPKLENYLSIDYKNFNKALTIVVHNAIRFSGENGLVRIKVDLKVEEETHFLMITVQDFGDGIPPQQLNILFKTGLENESESGVINYPKLSLQLPQAKMRVEAAGGRLECQSTVKQGTTVTLLTPYLVVSEECEQRLVPHERGIAACCKIKAFRILLVEDNPLTLQLEKNLLEALGCEVDIAMNGNEAVHLIGQNHYQLLLIDITLPDIDGIEVIKKIKLKGQALPPYIVAVTSHVTEDDIAYFLNSDVMTVLDKPATKQKLQDLLELIAAMENQALND